MEERPASRLPLVVGPKQNWCMNDRPKRVAPWAQCCNQPRKKRPQGFSRQDKKSINELMQELYTLWIEKQALLATVHRQLPKIKTLKKKRNVSSITLLRKSLASIQKEKVTTAVVWTVRWASNSFELPLKFLNRMLDGVIAVNQSSFLWKVWRGGSSHAGVKPFLATESSSCSVQSSLHISESATYVREITTVHFRPAEEWTVYGEEVPGWKR